MRPVFRDSARVAIVIVATATMTMTMTGQIVGAAQPRASSDTGFGSDWPVYHQNGLGGGVDTSGTDLSPATAAWTSTVLDGQIYGEPLVEPGGVIVATANDTVYELNPDTGAVIWSTHVGTPVPSGDLPCGDISPTVGITGTPVIDPTRGEVFAVTDELVDSSAQHYLVGIDLLTGEVLLHQAISLPGVDKVAQLQRTGLTLDDDNVVEGFGGNAGDCGVYHGWVISIPEGGGAQQSFEVASAAGDDQGAVWMGGAAPIVDASGNIWLATGNSALSSSSDTYDNSDGVIELNSDLVEQQFFAPSTWASDNGSDLDLGSSSPVLLGSGLVFQAGKSQTAYVMSSSSLGGVGGQLASAGSYCGADVDGGSAVVGNVVYTPCRARGGKDADQSGEPTHHHLDMADLDRIGRAPHRGRGSRMDDRPKQRGTLWTRCLDRECVSDLRPRLRGQPLPHTHGGRRFATGGVDEPGLRIRRTRRSASDPQRHRRVAHQLDHHPWTVRDRHCGRDR